MPKFKLWIFCFVLLACQNKQNNTVKPIEIHFEKQAELFFIDQKDTLINLDIELAESDFEQQTGLMHRKSMDRRRGMLFIYKDEKPRPTFYMKNTYIPLDLIYINADSEVVEINKNAKPFDETPIKAYKPAQYVLEVNAGFVDKFKITEGLSVSIQKL